MYDAILEHEYCFHLKNVKKRFTTTWKNANLRTRLRKDLEFFWKSAKKSQNEEILQFNFCKTCLVINRLPVRNTGGL